MTTVRGLQQHKRKFSAVKVANMETLELSMCEFLGHSSGTHLQDNGARWKAAAALHREQKFVRPFLYRDDVGEVLGGPSVVGDELGVNHASAESVRGKRFRLQRVWFVRGEGRTRCRTYRQPRWLLPRAETASLKSKKPHYKKPMRLYHHAPESLR